jgi:quercetin dioxygenase-like cupin family protein
MDMPGAKSVCMKLLVGRDDGAPTFSMRQFTVAPNGHTPQHKHNYEHEVYILEGDGQFIAGVDGNTIRPIKANDVVFVPANEMHQFRNVSTQPLKFICLVPTTFDCGSACQVTPGS